MKKSFAGLLILLAIVTTSYADSNEYEYNESQEQVTGNWYLEKALDFSLIAALQTLATTTTQIGKEPSPQKTIATNVAWLATYYGLSPQGLFDSFYSIPQEVFALVIATVLTPGSPLLQKDKIHQCLYITFLAHLAWKALPYYPIEEIKSYISQWSSYLLLLGVTTEGMLLAKQSYDNFDAAKATFTTLQTAIIAGVLQNVETLLTIGSEKFETAKMALHTEVWENNIYPALINFCNAIGEMDAIRLGLLGVVQEVAKKEE